MTVRSSLRHKQCDVIGDLCIPKHSRTWYQQYTKQYSFVFTFTNIFFIIGQDWYCLLNHCLSTQWGPHVRPRALPRAVFSFTNNNPFYYKQSSAVKTIAAKIKQWLRASTYCYEARSAHLTLLLHFYKKPSHVTIGVLELYLNLGALHFYKKSVTCNKWCSWILLQFGSIASL